MRNLLAISLLILLSFAASGQILNIVSIANDIDYIYLEPSNFTVSAGDVKELSLFAILMNGTREDLSLFFSFLDCTVSNNLGAIDSNGVFVAEREGRGEIFCIASINNALNASANVTVLVGEVYSIELIPSTPLRMQAGATQDLRAVITDRSGNVLSLRPTWKVNGGVGNIEQQSGSMAVFKATKAGTGSILVSAGGAVDMIPVEVIAGLLDHIFVEPAYVTLDVGTHQTFVATGYDAYNNTVEDVQFSWSTTDKNGNPMGLNVVNGPNMMDYSSNKNGSVIITASAQGKTGIARASIVGISLGDEQSGVFVFLLNALERLFSNPLVLVAVGVIILLVILLAILFAALKIVGKSFAKKFSFPVLPTGASMIIEGPVDSEKKELCYSLIKKSVTEGKQVAILALEPQEHNYWLDANLSKEQREKVQLVKIEQSLTPIGVELSKIIQEKKIDLVFLPDFPRLVLKEKFESITDFLSFNVEKLKKKNVASLFLLESQTIKQTTLSSLELLVDAVFEVKAENNVNYARTKHFVGRKLDQNWRQI